jgi:UDP-glucose 4-epimerase
MIVITGGTGYIGKNIALHLLLKGEIVYLLDNFSNSSDESYHKLKQIIIKNNIPEHHLNFCLIDLTCRHGVKNWLNVNYPYMKKMHNLTPIKAIIHCAGHKSVSDSISNSYEYYRNNICSTLNIMEIAKIINEENRKNNLTPVPIIFSSSITVYGEGSYILNETLSCDLQKITSPYGKSKFIIEEILKDSSNEIPVICLRYFNPIGCYDGLDEEIRDKSTNIIPSLIKSIKTNNIFNIYGDDYKTRDGTCIRDYIDVRDLADAHYLSLKYAIENMVNNFEIINIGSKNGVSVKELLTTFEKVNNIKIAHKISGRRAGDIPCTISHSAKAYNLLKWVPRYSLEESIRSIKL